MSSQTPRGGSRRKIAGERRAGRPTSTRTAPPTSDLPTDPATEPPASKTRTRTRKPAKAAPRRARTPSAGTRRAPSWQLVAILGVVTLVLVALTAYLGLVTWDIRDVRQADRVDEATKTAPSVAERAAATILSYDYQSLPADQKAAERYMTPKFRKEYDKSMRLVSENAPKLRAKVDAEVKASGVSDAQPDRADVLVYVDQTTTSTANSGEPQLALNRALFRMKRVNGTWLVDDITSY
jgi:Mce-associated membrane protein